MTDPAMLPLDVNFIVELNIDNRILAWMNEYQRAAFIEALHRFGATETVDYDGIQVTFDHGDEAQARQTVANALAVIRRR